MSETNGKKWVDKIRDVLKSAGITQEQIKLASDWKAPIQLSEVKTKEGVVINYEGDKLEGSKVFVIGADGVQSQAPEGDHVLENGDTITVSGGIVTAVKKADAPPAVDPAQMQAQMSAHKTALEAENKKLAARLEKAEKQLETVTVMLKALGDVEFPETPAKPTKSWDEMSNLEKAKEIRRMNG